MLIKKIRAILKRLRPSRIRLPKLTRLRLIMLVVGLGAVYALYANVPAFRPKPNNATGANSHTVITDSDSDVPKYQTSLPAGKTIENYGGWTRVSPDDRNPAFAYVDKINDTPINVSQQPIPDEFKPDTDVQIDNLAKGYKATQKIVAGSTTIYIGTSAKGPQSVIFVKGDLLFLIKSSVQIDPKKWAEYVNNLQ